MVASSSASSSPLQPFLDAVYRRYHSIEFLSSDPLEFVHRYADPNDQEVVAILGALMAYGNVKQIRASLQNALDRIQSKGEPPARWLDRVTGESVAASRNSGLSELDQTLEGWTHRFNVGSDLAVLLRLIAESRRRYGSVGQEWSHWQEKSNGDFEKTLNQLIQAWGAWARERAPGLRESFFYFLTAPENGSCCKRWCMLLRWMGRKDRLDPGLWRKDSPLMSRAKSPLGAEQLILPLDTHTGRISQYLGLTERKSLGWKAATEITARLRELDPQDPVKYDFALSRLGILDLCQKRYRVEICSNCALLPVCGYAARSMRLSGTRKVKTRT